MLNFYCTEKEIRLSNGKVISVKKGGVGYYYRLIYLLVEISTQTTELIKIQKYIMDAEERKNIAKLIVVINNLNKQLSVYIQPFINVKWNKIHKDDKDSVIKSVIEFNTFKKSSGDNENIIKKEQIEEEHNYIISFLISIGISYNESLNFNVYQAHVLLQEWTNRRIQGMYDTRVAYHATGEEYKKYELELRGYKFQNINNAVKGGF